ncbi:MAG: 30S ribosomal protein S10 [Methanobacteriota archaeon]|nr:MAG: 30S ribosomal protein S10 [Euryarchaeota archaeon]
MAKARIRLEGEKSKDLEYVTNQLQAMSRALNVKVRGTVRLPQKKLVIPTRRTPCGDGSDTYERWWKKISRWFVDVEGDEKSLRQLLRIRIPDNVYVKIILLSS